MAAYKAENDKGGDGYEEMRSILSQAHGLGRGWQSTFPRPHLIRQFVTIAARQQRSGLMCMMRHVHESHRHVHDILRVDEPPATKKHRKRQSADATIYYLTSDK